MLSVRLEMVQTHGGQAQPSAMVRATLDMAGRTVRVRAGVATVAQAVELLHGSLVYGLDRLGRRTAWPHPLAPGP